MTHSQVPIAAIPTSIFRGRPDRDPCKPVHVALLLGLTLIAALSAGCATVPSQALGGAEIFVPPDRGEILDHTWHVTAMGSEVPVYVAKVPSGDPAVRTQCASHPGQEQAYCDTAAFASFDMLGVVPVTVTGPDAIHSVRILPTSAGIVPTITGRTLSFSLNQPRLLTIEINGAWIRSLHLFADPMKREPMRNAEPDPNDHNIIYFGRGVHEISHLVVKSGQTLYIAGGAVLRAVIAPGEPSWIEKGSGLHCYAPTIELRGSHITVRGRGIIDGSACPTHARNMILVKGSDILIEGITLRDPGVWAIPVRQSDRVTIKDVKIIGYRDNSDGIDICNSRDVTVEDCFLRTFDDLVVIKTDRGQGQVHHVVVKRCVLWNTLAHALSVGAELQEPVDDVLFTDCDVIHDTGREWTMRIFQTDAALVSNVRFEHIRVEDAKQLISLWIGKAMWSRDSQAGHISGISFSDIEAHGSPLTIALQGADAAHRIDGVTFNRVRLNGRSLTTKQVVSNAFVSGVSIHP